VSSEVNVTIRITVPTGMAADVAKQKVRGVLDRHGIELDPDDEPRFSGQDGTVRCTILEGAWNMLDKAKMRADLQAEGFPGNFAVESFSKHGWGEDDQE
jgi:hypothetical protein